MEQYDPSNPSTLDAWLAKQETSEKKGCVCSGLTELVQSVKPAPELTRLEVSLATNEQEETGW